MRRYGRSGWFGERHRHYLAAKGISTARYMAIRREYAQGVYGYKDTDSKKFFPTEAAAKEYVAEQDEKRKQLDVKLQMKQAEYEKGILDELKEKEEKEEEALEIHYGEPDDDNLPEDDRYDEEYDFENSPEVSLEEQREGFKKTDRLRRKYGLTDFAGGYYDDSGYIDLVKERNGLALVKSFDNYAPSGESPVVYLILLPGGKQVWSGGIATIGKGDAEKVSEMLRKEAEQKFKELTKRKRK